MSDTMYALAQGIGVLAVATYLLSYQLKRRGHIVFVNGLSSILYVLQYLLLGAFDGAAIDAISAISAMTANGKERFKKYTILLACLFNLAIVGAGLVLYRNIFSLCSIVGAVLQISALWLTKEWQIRLVSFLSTPFWLVFNLTSQAYGPAVGSVLCMVSIASAIIRYDVYPCMKKNRR